MKRFFIVFVSILLCLLLSGCGDFALDPFEYLGKNSSEVVDSSLDAAVDQDDVFLDTEVTSEVESEKVSSLEESSKEEYSSEPSSSKEEVSSKRPATSTSSKKAESEAQTENHEKDTSGTVYVTPTGKRYHLDPDCGGKNSRPATLNDATGRGLTPCKKCAQ